MPFEMTFGELEAALAGMHQISSAKRTAFQARLKNFLRLGFPEYVRPGRGRAAAYNVGDFFSFSLALELTQLGINPFDAVGLITSSWVPVAGATSDVALDLQKDLDAPSLFLCLDPRSLSAMAELQDDHVSDIAKARLLRATADILRKYMGPYDFRRIALINLTAVVRLMAYSTGFREPDDIYPELADWAREKEKSEITRMAQRGEASALVSLNLQRQARTLDERSSNAVADFLDLVTRANKEPKDVDPQT